MGFCLQHGVLQGDIQASNLLDVALRQRSGSHGNGNQRMQWDLIADGSGNYADKPVDMTGSIMALSLYYMSA